MTNLFMKKLSNKLAKLPQIFVPIILIGFILAANIHAQENSAILTVFVTDRINMSAPVPTPFNSQFVTSDTRSWAKFKYNRQIAETSQKYDLDPQLIYATIMTESEGNEYAYRYEPYLNEPSLCLGQILISTARSLGFSDDPVKLFEPETCIDLIGKYHRKMLDTYKKLSPQQLARAYNTGSPWKRPVWGHLARFNKWYNEES